MTIPPPLSGDSYPNIVGAEERTNYVSFGLGVDVAYDDNVLTGQIAKPVSDTTYSITPNILYDRTEPRQRQTFIYSPGFTFFQPTSSLNAIDQNATLGYQYRINPYLAVVFGDSFVQTSNMFGQSFSSVVGGVSGSPTATTQTVIVPYASLLMNTVKGTLAYQFELNDMVGGSGSFGLLHFPNPSETQNLYDANTYEGTAFYSHRIKGGQYFGVSYQYERIVASPPNAESEAQIQAVVPFYTFYFGPRFSLSLTGGPEHYKVTQTALPTISAWAPIATGSLGWQRNRTNLSLSYSRAVTAGGGFLGAYNSNQATASARWQATRSWVIGLNADYAILKNVAQSTPQTIGFTNPGGHRITGTASLQRTLGEHFNIEVGYDRLHQSYSGIALIAANPDSNRVYGTVNYQFKKSLGR